MTSLKHSGNVWLGLDVHKDSIAAGVLGTQESSPRIELIGPGPDAVRRLIKKVSGSPERVRACYEAGPTGYELHRLLTGLGVRCEVIAPSLIPKAAGDRVKTDRRDAGRLARLLRAGELTAIRVPTPTEEAVRDLCRARADVVEDQRRARQRLGKFLLRHGVVYPGGRAWTVSYYQWLDQVRFAERALIETFRHYRAILAERDAALTAIDADLRPWCGRDPFAAQVRRLACYRGVAELAGLTFATEVCDWRRFPSAPSFMAFTGLIPSEYSSGGSQHRGHITHAGNEHLRTQLVESAWTYRYCAQIGRGLARRQAGNPPQTLARSWAAQRRLCARYRRLAAQTRPHRRGHRDRPRAGRVPLGRNDRGRLTMTTHPAGTPAGSGHHPRHPQHVTRRGTAVAGKIPVSIYARPLHPRAIQVRGHVLRNTDLPGPIREHQSGGLPIHNAPARHHPLSRPPPETQHTPASLAPPIIDRRSSASTSYVLAGSHPHRLRALHVDPSHATARTPQPRGSQPSTATQAKIR